MMMDLFLMADFGISAIVLGAISAATATASGIAQRKASKNQKEYNEKQQRKVDAKNAQENAFYRMQYYRDPLRTSEGMNTIATLRDYNKRLVDSAINRNVITGGTHESTIATRGQAMNSMGDAISNIRAKAESARGYAGYQWGHSMNRQYERQNKVDLAKHNADQQSAKNLVDNINNFSDVAQTVVGNMDMGYIGGGNKTAPKPTTNKGQAPSFEMAKIAGQAETLAKPVVMTPATAVDKIKPIKYNKYKGIMT